VIGNAVFGWFLSMATAFLNLIPVPAAPDMSGMLSAFSTVWADVAWLNNYLPCSEALAYAAVLIAAWLATHAYRASLWLATKAHILGGASD
jgi:hypothetical protein